MAFLFCHSPAVRAFTPCDVSHGVSLICMPVLCGFHPSEGLSKQERTPTSAAHAPATGPSQHTHTAVHATRRLLTRIACVT